MNDQEYQEEIQQLLDEQEASFEKPGWKRHFKTIGQIALVIGLLYLLVYVWHRYHYYSSPVVPEVVEGAEGDGVLSDVFGEGVGPLRPKGQLPGGEHSTREAFFLKFNLKIPVCYSSFLPMASMENSSSYLPESQLVTVLPWGGSAIPYLEFTHLRSNTKNSYFLTTKGTKGHKSLIR